MSDILTFDDIYGQTMARAFVQELEEIEKTAGPTMPISRFLNHPATAATAGGLSIGAAYGALFGGPVGAGAGVAAAGLYGGISKIRNIINNRAVRGRIGKAVNEGKSPTHYLSESQKGVIEQVRKSGKKKRVGANVASGAAGAALGAGAAKSASD